MLRTIGGVILGYVAMFIAVFATLTGAYLTLGADRTFLPGSYNVTTLWVVVSLVLSLVAALAGGRVCAWISGKQRAVTALAVVCLILGFLNAIPAIVASGQSPAVRSGDVPNLQAMMGAREPAWFALLLPFIGAAGVMIGGKRRA